MAKLGKLVKGRAKTKQSRKQGTQETAADEGDQTNDAEQTNFVQKVFEEKVSALGEMRRKSQEHSSAQIDVKEQQEQQAFEVRMTKLTHDKAYLSQKRELEDRQATSTDAEARMTLLKETRATRDKERSAGYQKLLEIKLAEIQRSSRVIDQLKCDIKLNSDHYDTALRTELSNFHKLSETQQENAMILRKAFDVRVDGLLANFKTEDELMTNDLSAVSNRIAALVDSERENESERKGSEAQDHEQLREEMRNKHLEDMNILKLSLENNTDELRKKIEKVHTHYTQANEQKAEDFKYLLKKDEELSKSIESKIRDMEQLQRLVSQWKAKITGHIKENQDRNEALFQQKRMILNQSLKLKESMEKFRKESKKKLHAQKVEHDGKKKKLEEQIALGKEILKLQKLASRYETEEERRALKQSAQALQERFTAVYLSYLVKHKELKELTVQRDYLKQVVKEIRAGITVQPDLMDKTNPLLVIKGTKQLRNQESLKHSLGANVTRQAGVAIIKGNQVIRKSRNQ